MPKTIAPPTAPDEDPVRESLVLIAADLTATGWWTPALVEAAADEGYFGSAAEYFRTVARLMPAAAERMTDAGVAGVLEASRPWTP